MIEKIKNSMNSAFLFKPLESKRKCGISGISKKGPFRIRERVQSNCFAINHCVNSVQIRSFFWSVFSCIWPECVFSPNTGKYGPEKTPYLDTFYAVSFLKLMKCKIFKCIKDI